MGLPVNDVGVCPGGGGMGLPVAERGIADGSAGAAGAPAPGVALAAGWARGWSSAGAAEGASAAAGADGVAAGAGAGRAGAGAGRTGAAASGSGSRRGGRGGCSLPEDVTTRFGAVGVGFGAASGAGVSAAGAASLAVGAAPGASAAGSAFGAASAASAVALVALAGFSALGGSGSASRISPSRSAFRRTRSACASSMLEEWLLAPIPSASQRSRVSLLESPSSLASSWMRILEAKWFFSPSSYCLEMMARGTCAWAPPRAVAATAPHRGADQSRTRRPSSTNELRGARRSGGSVLRR